MDYRNYNLNQKEIALCLLQSGGMSLLIAGLFYHSFWGILLALPLIPFFLYQCKEYGKVRQQRELSFGFKECIRLAAAAMRAGYSPENAFAEAEKELSHLLSEQDMMCRELREINRQVRLNIPLEKLLSEFAFRSGVEEIRIFAQVFAHAKRSGGDFIRILQETAQRISDKVEVLQEIQTVIAAKEMEQKIMNVIPLGILLMVSLGSPGFLDVLYQSAFGRCVMTLCLLIYGAAYLLSKRIVAIEV